MTINSINVSIPKEDMPFFRKLSEKMGWAYSNTSSQSVKNEILQSVEQSFRELKKAQESGGSLPNIDNLFKEF